MSSQSKYGVGEILALGPVVPVLIIEKVEDALPLAEALVEGGVRVLEVTLRTEAALAAIEIIAAKVPDAVVGAGTVVTPDQVGRVQDAGSRFIVSPGCYPALLDEVLAKGVPFLPGTATPSEVMALQARGLRHVKLFPAEAVGGLKLIKSLASPLPGVTFCPTGGITVKTAPDYLAQPNVACVGGSWLTPADLVAAKDWAGITRLAREASALGR
ncbi:bifunctional 4-hydroxy-2-oxoglutarate aldolase/2-dehydro-3-deoxy-phosphogluconate aldolase [Nitrospirillum sp. BR 11163]|uniref:bifunctional 4-hydroxy-2-oxoglutarate aldolase/2-dehydro-3-deoxy-phosphogluconate aldolase n=1 Tax=Nitrospirillum sp. BR 11163 TaxID=3104323 RepID=UPI002AFF449A|nr:bifunctional 4-hydroxy-2-oxoglutarate aldolase/2-dehydro-3-deoxy-phosphogluconate aldolase [Nitrospirillum sp. BR 11163]MEA1675270.1 bifunctional 4-hydroxy-2-oxoglutarate aldolase/2-dehydro-3-deoxy-phosphogluconate aldolase [Nitrospirillum sp. BR 11163]